MKVTFNKNKTWFEFEFDQDKFGEGSFNITNVTCRDLEVIDVDIEITDVHIIQQVGEIDLEYILNEKEWDELEKEIKSQIFDDLEGFEVYYHVSEEDQWNWYCYEQQLIQQANEAKF